jgi:hypothetical protein
MTFCVAARTKGFRGGRPHPAPEANDRFPLQKRKFRSTPLKVAFWPTAAVRLPESKGQFTWQTSRSTTRAWPAGMDHGSVHGAHLRVLDAGLSRILSELFNGPHLTD